MVGPLAAATAALAFVLVVPAAAVVGLVLGWWLRGVTGPDGSPDDAGDRFTALADRAPVGIVEVDRRGRIRYANPRWVHLGGPTEGPVWSAVHPADRAATQGRWRRARRAGEPFDARFRLTGPDGTEHRVRAHTAPVCDEAGRVSGHVGTLVEQTDLYEARRHLLRFRAVIESTTDFVGLADGDGKVLYLNPAARHAIGLAGDAALDDLRVRDFYPDDDWQRIGREVLPAVTAGEVWQGELRLRLPERPDQPLPVSTVVLASRQEPGVVDFLAVVARDTSEQKRLEAELQHQADHDRLTGLANRSPLLERLGAALERRVHDGRGVAVLFFDIDRFKVVNDSLGHDAGDRLLVAVGRRLAACTRPGDHLARFGGDEFVVVAEGVTGAEAAAAADRIRTGVGGRYALGDDEVYVTVSVGVAVAEGPITAEDLLRDADAAMYEAKAQGRDRVEVFDHEVRARVLDRHHVEQALRGALARGELALHFQPLIDLTDGGLSGVEALVRWEHPDRGLLLPGAFLRVAEETGLIVELGRWILTEACATAVAAGAVGPGGSPLPVYVNLSARQLADPDLVPMVREVIDLTGIDAPSVHFEITEDALMVDAETSRATLFDLRSLGVRLALDDFGTGHSSLAYLKSFPVEVLKIDRTFVEGLAEDPGDRAITAAIVNVARLLGLSTVAEGVERPDQVLRLAELGCDLAQGFHFARPMARTDLDRFLAERRTAHPT